MAKNRTISNKILVIMIEKLLILVILLEIQKNILLEYLIINIIIS